MITRRKGKKKGRRRRKGDKLCCAVGSIAIFIC